MDLIYWDEYNTKEELEKRLNSLKTQFNALMKDHLELQGKHETLRMEFEQLKTRYINLAK